MSEIIPMQPLQRQAGAKPDHPGYRAAGMFDETGAVVSAATKAAVLEHIACHDSAWLRSLHAPRMLAIGSKPGEGKDWQLSVILSRAGVDLVSIPAAMLAAPEEGAPIIVWTELAAFVKAKTAETGRPLAVSLQDLELGILSPADGVERTVNTDVANGLFNAELSWDNPMLTDCNGVPIPLFATGNDFTTGFRQSLLRDGRCQHISHAMTEDERAGAIDWLFDDADCSAALIAKYPDRGMAFFNAVKAGACSSLVAKVIALHGIGGAAIDKAMMGTDVFKTIGKDDVLAAAERVAKARPENYLEETTEQESNK